MIAIVAALTLSTNPSPENLPKIPREFRAAWVATVDNIDWPSKRNLTSDQQRTELLAIVEKAAALNLNALVFQIRPHADAMYPSKLEPWSAYLTGEQGRPPSPEWDPLKYMVEQCHRRGIAVHVWFNPYRADHPASKVPVSATHIARTNPELVKTYGNYRWMDPGEPAVRSRTMAVMMDVVNRYDIDGIHIDDYFYPYPSYANGAAFPDDSSYAKYTSGGGRLPKKDWRRENVNRFVKDFYQKLKQTKKYVSFGISPFGIFRSGIPAGIKAGIDQYDELYADCKKWINEGWCDYMAPQLYWPIAQKAQAFEPLLDWWVGQNTKGRHVWPGLYTGRTSKAEGNWPPSEIANQIRISRQKQSTAGDIHFSFKSLQQDFNGVGTALRNGVYSKSAFAPASPWLGDKKPSPPDIGMSVGPNTVSIEVSAKGVFEFAIAQGKLLANGKMEWGSWTTYSRGMNISKSNSTHLAAVAFSRTGIASSPQIQKIP